jgi:hypothetical protein
MKVIKSCFFWVVAAVVNIPLPEFHDDIEPPNVANQPRGRAFDVVFRLSAALRRASAGCIRLLGGLMV